MAMHFKHPNSKLTMKFSLFQLIILLGLWSCSKDTDHSELAKNMLSGKTWYLDYTIQNNTTKSFIGRNTYYIQFKEDQTTVDADGINGKYQVISNKNQLFLLVNGTTINGISANYNYQIDKIGYETLIISYTQNNSFIQKIFTIKH